MIQLSMLVEKIQIPSTISLNYKNIKKNMPFDGKTITSSDTVEVLRITLDKNIIFKRHIQNQSFFPYKKVTNQKIKRKY